MGKSPLSGYKTYDTSKGFGNPSEWRNAFKYRMSKEDAAEILKAKTQTPFAILGIDPGATQKEIKSAFRKLMMHWHPDKNPDREEEAKTMSQLIIAAFTELTE